MLITGGYQTSVSGMEDLVKVQGDCTFSKLSGPDNLENLTAEENAAAFPGTALTHTGQPGHTWRIPLCCRRTAGARTGSGGHYSNLSNV
jgi:hypothetical protein